jgi:hypothetical protein
MEDSDADETAAKPHGSPAASPLRSKSHTPHKGYHSTSPIKGGTPTVARPSSAAHIEDAAIQSLSQLIYVRFKITSNTSQTIYFNDSMPTLQLQSDFITQLAQLPSIANPECTRALLRILSRLCSHQASSRTRSKTLARIFLHSCLSTNNGRRYPGIDNGRSR